MIITAAFADFFVPLSREKAMEQAGIPVGRCLGVLHSGIGS